MTTTRELSNLRAEAEAITASGGTVTDRFKTISARWDTLRNATVDHRGTIARALTGDDEPDPKTLALAMEAAVNASSAAINKGAAAEADVLNDIARRIYPYLRGEWEKTVPENYKIARDAYNTAAAKLVKAIDTLDGNPDVAAEDLMSAPAKVRTAWAEIPFLTAQVDAAADFLTTAARHAGMTPDDAHRLGLTAVIPDDADRRTIWDAIDNADGRAGQWGVLNAHGAILIAPDNIDALTPYRRPAPYEIRYLPGTMRGSWRQVQYDPETGQPEGAILPRAGISL